LEQPYIRDDKISDTVGSAFAGTKVEDAAGAAKEKAAPAEELRKVEKPVWKGAIDALAGRLKVY
jgi:hypothetical protein